MLFLPPLLKGFGFYCIITLLFFLLFFLLVWVEGIHFLIFNQVMFYSLKKKKKLVIYIYTSHNSYMEISENIEHYFQSRDLRMSSCWAIIFLCILISGEFFLGYIPYSSEYILYFVSIGWIIPLGSKFSLCILVFC